jgi:formylglycine-generating enzyme required for sulfatase activity
MMKIEHSFSWRRSFWYAPSLKASALSALALLALTACTSPSQPARGLPTGLNELLSVDSYAQLRPGAFMMGSPEDEQYRALLKRRGFVDDIAARERPPHQVCITKPIQIGIYEVTQEQWEAVMQVNPSAFKGPRLPVTNVSWYDVQEFIKSLQPLDEKHIYRLPTEAEWEYACRAGSSGDFSGQDDESNPRANEARSRTNQSQQNNAVAAQAEDAAHKASLTAYLQVRAWFAVNSLDRPRGVGQLQPNAWGLYDIHGNVSEWCQDWFAPRYYRDSPAEDPPGPPVGTLKVNRGGHWQASAMLCRAATRSYDAPTERNQLIGFRLVRVQREME